MGFRPNTKGNPAQPKTGVDQAFRARRRYIRKQWRKPMKKKVNKNTATIAQLLTRVRLNELDKHGQIQTNKQLSEIPTTTPPYPQATMDVRQRYPILFNVNNFASQPADLPMSATALRCPIFQMNGPAGSAVVTQVADFRRSNYLGVSAPIDALKASLWAPKNLDIPDTGKYYAQSSHYKITVTCKARVRINIMFFTQRPSSFPTSNLAARNLILPEALDGLGFMGSGNNLPRSGFKIYKKYEKLMDPTTNQSSGINTFYFNFKHDRLINQFATKPATADTDLPTPLTGWNFENIPITQPLWCLISSTMLGSPYEPPPAPANEVPVLCAVQRTVKWRDHIGADAWAHE